MFLPVCGLFIVLESWTRLYDLNGWSGRGPLCVPACLGHIVDWEFGDSFNLVIWRLTRELLKLNFFMCIYLLYHIITIHTSLSQCIDHAWPLPVSLYLWVLQNTSTKFKAVAMVIIFTTTSGALHCWMFHRFSQ